MNYIFWFSEDTSIYWHGIIMAFAVLAAVLSASGFRRAQGRNDNSVLFITVIGMPLALILSRIVFWNFSRAYFDGFGSSLLNFADGGYSLLGAMIGVLLAVIFTNSLLKLNDFKALLDAISPAAAIGICIGRLSGYFSLDDRGKILETDAVRRFPFAVYDASSDNWRLAVFSLEAIAAGLIFIVCTAMFVYIYRCSTKIRSGNVFLLFLCLFGVTQGTLESMRLDSLFMNSLGFVRVMQIASLVMIVFVLVVYSVTSIKRAGFRLFHIVCWVASLGLLGLAFYMEFRIHSAVLMRNYAVMITCLTAVGYLSYRLFALSYSGTRNGSGVWARIGRR